MNAEKVQDRRKGKISQFARLYSSSRTSAKGLLQTLVSPFFLLSLFLFLSFVLFSVFDPLLSRLHPLYCSQLSRCVLQRCLTRTMNKAPLLGTRHNVASRFIRDPENMEVHISLSSNVSSYRDGDARLYKPYGILIWIFSLKQK